VGEDGPTHQPVEHLASLRAIPGLLTIRPADANEVVEAWRVVLQLRHEPVALVLTRQALPTLDRTRWAPAAGLARGAYVLAEPSEVGIKKKAAAVIIATGSEVQWALHAQQQLAQQGIAVRVVSMPSTSVFDRQDKDYKKAVLPKKLPRVVIEAGVSDGWWKYQPDAVIGIDRYGSSAPGEINMEKFGFTAENVARVAKALAKSVG